MSDNANNETKELISSFVNETIESIDEIENRLLNLGNDYNDETINTIFRKFHSIKGNAACLNFENIKKITHEAETLLDIFRKNKINPEQDDIDILYGTCDMLKTMISEIGTNFSDKKFDGEIDDTTLLIKTCIENNMVEKKYADQTDVKKLDFSGLVTQEIIESYIIESNEIFDKIEKNLLDLEKNPADLELIKDTFRHVHTFKGNSSFIGFYEIESKISQIETLLDRARNGNFTIDNQVVSFLLTNIDIFRRLVNSIDVSAKTISGKNLAETESIRNIIDDNDGFKPLGEILIEMGASNREAVDKALKIQQEINAKTRNEKDLTQKKSIRVDTIKLDKLFDLVGELITAGAMISHNPETDEIQTEIYKKSVNYFNKITRELQEITMAIRMIPLAGLFNKMKRLVRDLAKKSGKPVNFTVSGEETEMDKNLIEELSDPLLHILRNAIDHGIENVESRNEKGKPGSGTVHLDARYEGNEIWIIIKDDGKGLDRNKILAKAKDKGLLKSDPDALTDAEVWNFIMEPGFSTADIVSDISGRGVGMDVVRKNIEKLHGKIDIKTVSGKGTEFILKIPLTMAIIDVINFKIGHNLYSISLIDTLEFSRVDTSHITIVEENRSVLNLRGELIPIIKLNEYFKIFRGIKELTDQIAIIVQYNGTKACFLVDEVVGNQQVVIKSLTDYLGSSKGISGCSIMGNGDVSLIIDTGKIINDNLKVELKAESA